MKLPIINATKTEVGKRELPPQFSEPVRSDIVKKAVQAIQANTRQPYGADPMAGKRASAELSRRRRKYRGSYGIGISRVPRKILSRRGTRMNWVGAFAPGTVKGRRAHPPKAGKSWSQKVNTKERRKAIRSAISATVVKALVQKRGHLVPESYPFILDSKVQDIQKTKDARALLQKIGLSEELKRVSVKKVRAGRGTMRGRKYRKKTGPLLVVSGRCGLIDAARNISGTDVVSVDKLNAGHLAPGVRLGRLTLFTEKAIDRLEKEHLFTEDVKKPAKKEDNQVKATKAESNGPGN
jgi:large subunit ribosomal protein L4e